MLRLRMLGWRRLQQLQNDYLELCRSHCITVDLCEIFVQRCGRLKEQGVACDGRLRQYDRGSADDGYG